MGRDMEAVWEGRRGKIEVRWVVDRETKEKEQVTGVAGECGRMFLRCKLIPLVLQLIFFAAPGMAMVEIVDFQGRTAPTTRFEIQTAPITIHVKTNYQPTGSTELKLERS